MTTTPLYFPPEMLARQIRGILNHWGMSPEDIAKTVDAMMYADLSGIDSHGISMLMTYARLRSSGNLKIAAPRTVLRRTSAIATIDGGGGLGHPVAVDAMHLAAEMAETMGVGAVAVRNSHHFGALGYYARIASDRGLFGIVTTSTRLTSVIPTGSRRSMLGTNPIAFAAPGLTEEPIVLDMSTSTVASNKVRSTALKGRRIPEGWVVDAEGRAMTDPEAAYEAIQHDEHAGLTPLGGQGTSGGGHKGYGLGLMIQILSCGLSGAGQPGDDEIGHFFLALDPRAFAPEGVSTAYMDELLCRMRNAEPRETGHPVQVPGDPEAAERRRRSEGGIPMPASLHEKLRDLCRETGTAFELTV